MDDEMDLMDKEFMDNMDAMDPGRAEYQVIREQCP